jgi:predicted phosphodiesterase
MSTGKQSPSPEDPRSDLKPHRQTHRPAPFSSSPSYDVKMLSQTTLIGIMGDLHGDIEHALQAFKTLADRGVHVIVQLGDWGVLWPGRNWQIDLNKVSSALARHQMTMYFLDGNHDWHPKLGAYPVDPDGLRWIANNVAHLPRGYRAQIGEFTLAILGGANSIDRELRKEGISWWPEEQITEADLRRLGSERADVLVGHEAPLMDEPDLEQRARELGFSTDDIRYATESRVMFRRAVLQTRPRLTLGGHYHHFHDQVLTVPGAAYPTRVVVLDMNGTNRVILDTATLGLEFLYRNGAPAVPDTHEPERTDDGRPGS